VLLAIVVIETTALIWQSHKMRTAQAIRLDGQIACFVKNARTAEAVHARLLKDGKGKLPGAAFLEQKWENLAWPLGKEDKILSASEAIAALKLKVTVKVASAAIQSRQQDLVVLPDKETAQMVLDLLKKQLSEGPGKIIKVDFAPQDEVKIADVKYPPSAIKSDVSEAAKQLLEPRIERYVVQNGDSWRKIADDNGTTIKALRDKNKHLDSTLKVGDVIQIGTDKTMLTVSTIREETRDEEYSAPPERVMSDALAQGITRKAGEAKPGKRTVTETVTYLNGKEVSRKRVNEVVTVPAVAERIMVGTASPDAAPN